MKNLLYREVCLENYTDLPQAVLDGADRIEICDNLAVGGTTISKPSNIPMKKIFP